MALGGIWRPACPGETDQIPGVTAVCKCYRLACSAASAVFVTTCCLDTLGASSNPLRVSPVSVALRYQVGAPPPVQSLDHFDRHGFDVPCVYHDCERRQLAVCRTPAGREHSSHPRHRVEPVAHCSACIAIPSAGNLYGLGHPDRRWRGQQSGYCVCHPDCHCHQQSQPERQPDFADF